MRIVFRFIAKCSGYYYLYNRISIVFEGKVFHSLIP